VVQAPSPTSAIEASRTATTRREGITESSQQP
jgi:hypothetical protein